MRASALAEARTAEARAQAGARLGPLDGIPIAVKDLYDTAGVVTAAGTGAYRERVPLADATAVRLLREAVAVLLGKTNTHELAMGGTTNNVHFGATHNLWHVDRVPGGSSGGSSAALAAGQTLGAMGTDTGGSIRIPAAFCGVTGHKPTYGIVGRGGIVPLSLTLDHAGPMARTVEDCAILLGVLAGSDPRDIDSANHPAEAYVNGPAIPVRGLRLAVIPSLVEGCEPAVLANFESSLEVLHGLGIEVGEAEPVAGFADDWRGLVTSLLAVEAASYIDGVLAKRPHSIGEPVRSRL
ncbi:MAG: amidase [Dehalococcoidia bacterium]|nr:amidase [Dehalococcoidia bacterium]